MDNPEEKEGKKSQHGQSKLDIAEPAPDGQIHVNARDLEWLILNVYGNSMNNVKRTEEGIWTDKHFILNICFSMSFF